MKLQPGVRVGAGLELLRPLGEGAMGSVWEARRPEGERVAVKFASEAVVDDPTDRARFSREAALVNKLESPHVVESFGFGLTDDSTPFIVMELLEGETLADRLRRDKVVPARELATIVEQMAEALDEAHDLGIVHRDVKPANVFLLDRGEGTYVKVLDFGMAKRTDSLNPTVVTEEGTSVGTPDFMAPEQIQNAKDLDPRTDIWSLGVLVYRALVGRLPFTSGTFAGLCVAICEGRYRPPSELAPNLAGLDPWFERCLAVDRDDRFSSAGEAAQALEVALGLREPPDEDGASVAELSLSDADVAAISDPAYPPPRPHRWLDATIAILVGFTAFCVGALVATMDRW